MRGCAQDLAGILAAVFVVTAVFALFTVNLAEVATNRAAVKAVMPKQTLSEDVVPALVAETAREQARLMDAPLVDVEPTVLQTVIRQAVPAPWINAQVDRAIDTTFDFLESENQASVTLQVDARPILARLRGDAGRQAIAAGLQQLPTCAESQRGFNPATGYFEDDSCLPPNLPVTQIAGRVHSVVLDTLDQSTALAQPDTLDLTLLDETTLSSTTRARLQQVRLIFSLIQDQAWLLWLIPLAALLFMTLLTARSFSDFSYWWGWSLLVAGILALFFAFFAPPLLTATALRTITTPSGSLGAALIEAVQQTLDALLDVWMSDVYLQAGLMLAGGILLLLAGVVKRRTSSRPPA